MNLSIQQKIWTIAIHVKDKDGNESLFTSSNPLRLIDLSISKIDFKQLTISEHHKVKAQYDGEVDLPKYNGYKAVDSNGNIYYNEFPLASGGFNQISTSMFTLDLVHSTEDVGDIDTYLNKLVQQDSTPFLYSLTDFLYGIDGGLLKNGITDIEKNVPDIAKLLKDISRKIQQSFLNQTGFTIEPVVKPFLKWEKKDWILQNHLKSFVKS